MNPATNRKYITRANTGATWIITLCTELTKNNDILP